MKVHVATTDAGIHDSQRVGELLHGRGKRFLGIGHMLIRVGERRWSHRVSAVGSIVRYVEVRNSIVLIGSFNRKSNRTRAKVEYIFGLVKHLWGYHKVRYRRIEKNAAQAFALMALANFHLFRREVVAYCIVALKNN